jgi:hypothetical protein
MKKLPKLLAFSLALFLTATTLPAQQYVYCEGYCTGIYVGSVWCSYPDEHCSVVCYAPGNGYIECV